MLKLAAFVLLIFALAGCSESNVVHHKFKKGQIIESVLTGQRGQVIDTFIVKSEPRYEVRFQAAAPVLDGGFLKGAEKMEFQPIITIYLREYELRPVSDGQCSTLGCKIN